MEYYKYNSSSNSNETKQDLVFEVVDSLFINYRDFRWKEAYASGSKLQGQENKNEGTYSFKLKK